MFLLSLLANRPHSTGKSAAILCAALSWQRFHHKREQERRNNDGSEDPNGEGTGGKPDRVKIIYCSRTHSQVAQMVAS